MVRTTTGNNRLRVAIVGGGISGLSAAWYLEKQAEANGLELDYVVLEQSERFGGKILTEYVSDTAETSFVVEAGPDSFLTQKPWALQLARELGLDDELLGTNDEMRNVFVLNKGRPVILPDGVLLIVPTKFMPFVLSPLISPLGKLRMGLDLVIPAKRDDEDETLADFIKRRLGSEALDKIAEPLLSGIYNAEADRQSIMATFPRFRNLEKQYGSLTRGMLASRRKRQQQSTQSPGKKLSTFMSFRNGTQDLINTLTSQLSGELRTRASVSAIRPQDDGTYMVELDNAGSSHVDAVLLTTPAFVTAQLVSDFAPTVAQKLERIRYVSTGTISLAFHQSDIPRPLTGFGLVVPSSENRPINAVTMSSTKFDRRAPQGRVLLRTFFGGSRSPQSMDLDDESLVAMVRSELHDILGITAESLFHRIYRWWRANPQYDVGHLEWVDEIESELPVGLYVTGSAYRGVGMPDCVHQSQQIAERLVNEYLVRVVTV